MASSTYLGSIWERKVAFAQKFLREDRVWTPFDVSPKISSLGWASTYFQSLGKDVSEVDVVESQILMIKSIDGLIDLIHIIELSVQD